jgi:uncharacterized protein YqfB (UPF0267 family)
VCFEVIRYEDDEFKGEIADIESGTKLVIYRYDDKTKSFTKQDSVDVDELQELIQPI